LLCAADNRRVRLPWVFTHATRRLFRDTDHAKQSLSRFARRWIPADQQALRQPGIRDVMAASLAQAYQPGIRGVAHDATVFGRNWGFQPDDLTIPVHLWHGERDNEISIRTARALAVRIPNCAATFPPDEGHISTIVNYGSQIVRTLTLR
jgi:pimeloyl-ACP methyl ester carboxylesterase